MVAVAAPAVNGAASAEALVGAEAALLDGNLQVVDLTDLDGDVPLDIVASTQVLWQTEDWEISTWQNPAWPAPNGRDTVGFPTLVRNDRGPGADGRYYLYYSHHDPSGGVGVAVADVVTGPFSKDVNVPGRSDNLVVPSFQFPAHPDSPDHSSSPWVVWSEQEQLWFMYFHYFNHVRNVVPGFQLTAMATTPDLASHQWTIWEDASGGTTPPYRPVLPTTGAVWISEASSYNTVHRLPDGRWIAFLRGTSTVAGDPPKLGFATSTNGRNWDYFDENPILHQSDGGGGRAGVYRPGFIGYLGPDEHGDDEYLVAWEESHYFDGDARLTFGYTTDFKTITRDPRGPVNWEGSDGPISAWREGDRLYLFSGKFVHEVVLPVRPRPEGVPLPHQVDFNDGAADGFGPVAGDWRVSAGTYTATAASGQAAVALLATLEPLPAMLRVGATIEGREGGASRNGLIVFDYGDAGNFKFAGAFFGVDEWRIGRFIDGQLTVDAALPEALDTDVPYRVDVLLDDRHVTLSVAGVTRLTHVFGGPLTDGRLGLGTQKAVTSFDDFVAVAPVPLPYVERFEDGRAAHQLAVSGSWDVNAAMRYRAIAEADEVAIARLALAAPLSESFIYDAIIRPRESGPSRNGLIVFDYHSPTDFKFAGVFVGAERWRIGRVVGAEWIFAAEAPGTLRAEVDYPVRLSVHDRTVTLASAGDVRVSHTFLNPVNDGDLGLATRQAQAAFDDLRVVAAGSLPLLEDFDDGRVDHLVPMAGVWSINSANRYDASVGDDGDPVALVALAGPVPERLTMATTIKSKTTPDRSHNGVIIFDYRGPTDFKFAGGFMGAGEWWMGHREVASWVADVRLADTIEQEVLYALELELDGRQATLRVDGDVMLSHTFEDALVEGDLGLGTRDARTVFDDLVIRAVPPRVTVAPLLTADPTPALHGTVDEPGAAVAVTIGDRTYEATNVGDGTWSLADDAIATPLAEGVHDVAVLATGASGAAGADDTTDELTIDLTPPRVDLVVVNGTTWTPAFRAALEAAGRGHPIAVHPTGPTPTVPWAGLDQLMLVFSEPVALVDADLDLHGASLPVPAVVGFAWDGDVATGTWTLAAPLASDRLSLALVDTVRDAAGHRLQGDAAFHLDVRIVVGDANGDGVASIRDVRRFRNTLGAVLGAGNYAPEADLDGDGRVDRADIDLFLTWLGTRVA